MTGGRDDVSQLQDPTIPRTSDLGDLDRGRTNVDAEAARRSIAESSDKLTGCRNDVEGGHLTFPSQEREVFWPAIRRPARWQRGGHPSFRAFCECPSGRV